ncbi:PREDICTED: phospholipid phosphatase 6-like [Trachymyrmex septentrionalis]|uniref:phospholipid phosphatase 6-like n=1 Tax=Trachymyrmex septentrionalis TaxID=34720 RepID=UPI00084F5E78|nr:PREDICTED: phospholipid phosphatase 6-like [Trachymyrmex septentrionalis]
MNVCKCKEDIADKRIATIAVNSPEQHSLSGDENVPVIPESSEIPSTTTQSSSIVEYRPRQSTSSDGGSVPMSSGVQSITTQSSPTWESSSKQRRLDSGNYSLCLYHILRQLKVHNKLLEISCHGIPWLAVSLISIWVFNAKSLYQMQMNLLIGLLLDIIVIAVLKAVTRRRRPTTNDDPFSLGPDKYSFPSGHSSRSAFVVYFFFNLWPISLIYSPPLLAWSFSVCMSRLLMRRHYILDVIGGILLGIFEGLLIGYIYLEQETCMYLISWIADDKIPGSE